MRQVVQEGSPPSEGVKTRALAVRRRGELVPVPEPDPRTAAGFLRLSAHVLLQAKSKRIRTIGMVSPEEGSGSTNAAINLAICLGRTEGRAGRVLLVDGDTNERSLTEMLGASEGVPEHAHHPMLVITRFKGVDLMTAPTRTDALTLHDPDVWMRTLTALSSRYSMIVVDCPSALDRPEGMVLPSCVDELILVIRAGATSKEMIQRTLTGIDRDVFGVILNGGQGRNGMPRKRRGGRKR